MKKLIDKQLKFSRMNEKSLESMKEFRLISDLLPNDLEAIVELAAQLCQVPMAFIRIVEDETFLVKSSCGIDEGSFTEDLKYCEQALSQADAVIVEDTWREKLSEKIENGKMRFIAAVQLKASGNIKIGILCVADFMPRQISPEKIAILKTLANQVVLNLENKKLARSLAERKRVVSHVLTALPDAISYLDAQLRYRYISCSYEKWFKIKSQSVIGKTGAEIHGAKLYEPYKILLERALKGEAQDYESSIPSLKEGETPNKVYRIQNLPDVLPNGEIQGIFSILTDITSFKESERIALGQTDKLKRALKHQTESAKSFEAIFNHSPIGMVHVDENLKFLSVNETFANFVGYAQTELLEMSLLDVTHSEDVELCRSFFNDVLSKESAFSGFEKRYICKDGQTVWGKVSGRTVYFEEIAKFHLFSGIENVTQIREHEIQLRAIQDQLLSVAKMAALGEMASGVAHEINNPLAIITAKSEVILRRISDGPIDVERLSNDLKIIQSTGDRIAKIVKGLKSFSRKSDEDSMVETSVKKIIDEVTELCKERFKNADIPLKVECREDFHLLCNATEISQVLMNLLNNSFDEIQSLDEKWVSISVVRENLIAQFKVVDSGRGIPDAISSKIMDPFFTTKNVGKGTGLGLSISKKIAEVHEGNLRHDPKNKNTCFILELPTRLAKVS